MRLHMEYGDWHLAQSTEMNQNPSEPGWRGTTAF
jgi:hypothetical protein